MAVSKASRVLLLIAGALFVRNAAAVYVFSTVQLPNSTFNDVRGINDAGRLVGYSDIGSYSYSNGAFTSLPPPPAAFVSAVAINNAGTIAGSVYDANFTSEQAFALNTGTYTTFAHPGYSFTEARAISNAGVISGIAFNNQNTLGIGFLYDPTTKAFTDIAAPAGGQSLIAQGLNTVGQQVGSFKTATTTSSYLRQSDGTIATFNVNNLPTNARAINDSGLIAGWVAQGSGRIATFVGNSNGYQLLSMPGAFQTVAEGINNAGQIVGLYYNVNDLVNQHAFIATPAVLPVGTAANGAFVFNTAVIANVPIFIDPQFATGYYYAIGAGDPDFASVLLPIGVGDSLYTLTVAGQSFVLAGGDLFDFRAHGFASGVGAFEVSGIEVDAAIDPFDVNGFVTQVSFVASGRFTGTQTPITTAAVVSEPETLGVLAVGITLLGLQRRRRRR